MAKVSVIIVNHNGAPFLRECLEALDAQTYADREIIVVDNASTDGSARLLDERGPPPVRVVRLDTNVGFAGANVEGLKAASGSLVATVNPDVTVSPDWLAELTGAMDAYPEAGMCASKMVRRDRPDLVDSAGDGCSTSGHGIKHGEGEPAARHAEARWVFGACGGAALYRRRMIDEIGFFAPELFLISEDTDLNWRAQAAGWACRYVPSAVARHRVSAAIGRGSDLAVRYASRNSLLVWIRNMPGPLMVRYFHHKLLQDAADCLRYAVRAGRWRAYLGGKIAALRMAAWAVRTRRDLARRRRVPVARLRAVLTPMLDRRTMPGKLRRLFGVGAAGPESAGATPWAS